MIKTYLNNKKYYGTGRRKTAVAKVFLKSGTGKIEINCKSIDDFFDRETAKLITQQPFNVIGSPNKFDVKITVKGGGNIGQAEAIRHGITRALLQIEDEQKEIEPLKNYEIDSYRKKLRNAGYVTRDSRVVERKKVGCRKARKKEQYSKR